MLDLAHDVVRREGPDRAATAALECLVPNVDGFRIHVDADVLDPSVLPAVDSPEPDGLTLEELGDPLTPLARHPSAIGLELTIYDPALDADGAGAARLAALLHRVLGGNGHSLTGREGFWEALVRSHR